MASASSRWAAASRPPRSSIALSCRPRGGEVGVLYLFIYIFFSCVVFGLHFFLNKVVFLPGTMMISHSVRQRKSFPLQGLVFRANAAGHFALLSGPGLR